MNQCPNREQFAWIIAGVACLLITSCKMASQLVSGSACSAAGVCVKTGSDTGPSTESPFKITLKSYWEDDENNTIPTSHPLLLMHPFEKDVQDPPSEDVDLGLPCDIPADAEMADSTLYSSDPNGDYFKAMRTCKAVIPETQLFRSKLEFTVETRENHQCDVVKTFPNFYLASRSKKFVPPWNPDQEIDCEDIASGGFPKNKDCYNGAAKQLIDGFPNFTFLSQSISNKKPKHVRKWLVDPARKAQNGSSSAGNLWTTFQPNRFFFPKWDSENFNDSTLMVNTLSSARRVVGNSHTWHFQCVKEGSNLNYQYEIRIFTKDDVVNEGAIRPLDWRDWNGTRPTEPIGKLSHTQGPIDGEFEIEILKAEDTPYDSISKSDTIILCKKETECTPITPPRNPRYFCQIDPNGDNETHVCKMPTIAKSQAGTYLVWHAKSNTLMKAADDGVEFEYKLLAVDETDPFSGSSGPATGGQEITLKGEGFAKDIQVTIGGQACPVVADSLNETFTEVKCTTPALTLPTGVATNSFEIRLKNPKSKQEKVATSGDKPFTYFRPVVTNATGGPCEVGATCQITLTGGFPELWDGYAVTIGGLECGDPNPNGDRTELICNFSVPAGTAAGGKAVVVKDAFNQEVTAPQQITVTDPAPENPAPEDPPDPPEEEE